MTGGRRFLQPVTLICIALAGPSGAPAYLLTGGRRAAIFNPQVEYSMAAPASPLHQTFLALADPTRRAILQRLSCGDARVTDLASPFAISLNAVSKHIRVLEQARLVKRHRAGREHFLSLNPQPLDTASKWIEEQRSAWMSRLDALDALLRAEDRAAKKLSRKRHIER
jgi:DNA-binding transcriptional ArsR family regulator